MPIKPACRQTLTDNVPTRNTLERGKKFRWCGRVWTVLDMLYDDRSGALYFLSIMNDPAWRDCVAFGEDNNWERSSVRRRLADEVLPTLNLQMLGIIETDMTDEGGLDNYGTCQDYISLLTADAYRAYRKWMPRYRDWIWLATPNNSAPGHALYVRFVNTSGALDHYYAHRASGLVPGLCAISQFALANGEIEVIDG